MNNPLRLFGDTFYQSGFHESGVFFGERSTLSVVTNGGWMIPYVCCMIVAVGMAYQFLLTLLRFLTRLATPAPAAALAAGSSEGHPEVRGGNGAGQGGGVTPVRRETRDRQPPKRDRQPATPVAATIVESKAWRWVLFLFPLIVLLFFVAYVGRKMSPPRAEKAGELRLVEFSKIPVVYEGRVKPLDSLARNAMIVLSGRQEYIDYHVTDADVSVLGKVMQTVTGNPAYGKPKTPAITWLLDLMSGSPDARKQPIIRVDNGEVLRTLDLKARKGFLYSYEEITANRKAYETAAKEASEEQERNPRGLSVFQRKILKLSEQLLLFDKLMLASVVPPARGSTGQAVDFLAGVADLRERDRLKTAPFLVPRDSASVPWEPLAYAGARAKVHELAEEHGAKNRSELQRALLKDLTSEEINRRVAFYLIQTLESILAQNSEKKLDPQELRRLAMQKYDDMPTEMRQKLEDRAREEILSDRLALTAEIKETYGPAIERTLQELVGDEPLGKPDPVAVALAQMLNAARDRDASGFNSALDDYGQAMAAAAPRDYKPGKTRFEAYFNHSAPFFYAAVLHLFAFLFVILSWLLALLGWRRPLNRASFALIVLAMLIHTFALIARLYISGRPPVTNLYSSAVFIGWGAVLFGIVIELFLRLGIGNALASMAGFSTLLIAHYLAMDGDTFTVLQAVLDTQFWLATHVVCITLGYAATFVAGVLGILYVLGGVLSPVLGRRLGEMSPTSTAVVATISPAVGLAAIAGRSSMPTMTLSQLLGKVIYGVICFALIFSFIGTVLGGLWADDSWGRFWGWDPKENGALIIVIWNAIVLHARWGGMVKDRGLAVLSLGGNIVTAWSWFGVNELGIGLHSYGFTEGVLLALGVWVAVQFALIIVGSLPKSWWWSFSTPEGGAGQGGAT
jgi:cytochrome c-type biogenesis protein CcsB